MDRSESPPRNTSSPPAADRPPVPPPESTQRAPAAPPRIRAESIYGRVESGVDDSSGAVRLQDLEDEAPLTALELGRGKYQLVRELGAGGMGRVYLAYDHDLKRRVALKVVKTLDPDLAQRFIQEAQVMAQLQHPYIVPVFEVGLTEDHRPYYTMPVVRGRSLRDVLVDIVAGDREARREYSLTRRVQIFVQVCQAVAYAHAKGVIHRDLKPGNVMLGRHGEVQVMDWGLSKVFERDHRSAIDPRRIGSDPGASTPLVGTPGYMAPEQIAGDGSDERSDIYALGAVLYELLTLTWPFDGTISDILTAHVSELPQPPSQRAPQIHIPFELESVALRALAKRRDDRFPTVAAMRAEVQYWIEAEADRTRRHELAEARAAEGQAQFAAYRQQQEALAQLRLQAAQVAGEFESWQPVAEKAALFAAEDRVRDAERRVARLASSTVNALSDALAFEENNTTARTLLATYYWDRFRQAEAERNERDIDFFGAQVAKYHGGKYASELVGDGSLTLDATPRATAVTLYTLGEDGPVLAASAPLSLGPTPVAMTLAMGSYLAILDRDSHVPTRYPIHIARGTDWRGQVRLLTPAQLPPGFVHIPAGPCILGGDPLPHRSLARTEPELGDFLIGIHPVTMGEYVEYLQARLADEAVGDVLRAAPRPSPEAPSYFLYDSDQGIRLPPPDPQGTPWQPRLPVVGISWHDAIEYCAWRSERDGRRYRLPDESEWEKAARGVDGRLYPWGDRFDPSLCNMRESLRERPALVPIDAFPSDVSIYGVRGMGGNVQDWTATASIEGTAKRLGRVARGGAWLYSRSNPRVACRSVYLPSSTLDLVGFRLVTDLA